MTNSYTNTNGNQIRYSNPFNIQDYAHPFSIDKIELPTYQITQYEAVNKSEVQKTVSIDTILDAIKNGNKYLPTIEKARKIGKGNKGYDSIKKNQLPTFRFNFLFQDSVKNTNIIAPTGLLYLDADNIETIPDNDYVFAKWKSLSNLGFGILVKIDNLTQMNFRDAYNQLSEVIGITTDSGARKATQQTVLSYDSELYYNCNSTVYKYKEIKKVSLGNTLKKEKKGILPNDTLIENTKYDAVRFNNISDYFTGENAETPYLVFGGDKTKICQPFIPNTIKEGARNSTMFTVLSNYSTLNRACGKGLLEIISNQLNDKMHPKLSEFEVNKIIENVLKKRADGELEMYLNKERRILFNPNIALTRQEKQQITGREIGKIRKDATRLKIYLILESWDFEKDGKITQRKVSIEAGLSILTIKRYWHEFKDYIDGLHS
ncbi:hypothetical protein [Flavobacterium sp. ZS1P14]|uniref:hypothetical protein n=1 Tax=Flavobacterium sp. ZS1P14 TaxID=3401729 RepID=UPI003AABD63E